MNLIGKILTLLILIMSIFFFVVAIMLGAAQRNWKQEATEATSRAQAATALLDEAKSKSGEKQRLLEAEKTARALQLSQLESQIATFRAQLQEKESQLRDETVASQERLARLKEAEARLAQQDSELGSVKTRNSKLVDELADKFARVTNLTNEQSELETRAGVQEELIADLNESIAVKTKVMTVNGLDDQALTADIVPSIDAVVAETGNHGFFVVSIGADDGIREGHTMDIYRGDRFIGKATVYKVQPNMAVFRTIDGFMQDNVAEGDHVTSKL